VNAESIRCRGRPVYGGAAIKGGRFHRQPAREIQNTNRIIAFRWADLRWPTPAPASRTLHLEGLRSRRQAKTPCMPGKPNSAAGMPPLPRPRTQREPDLRNSHPVCMRTFERHRSAGRSGAHRHGSFGDLLTAQDVRHPRLPDSTPQGGAGKATTKGLTAAAAHHGADTGKERPSRVTRAESRALMCRDQLSKAPNPE